MMNGWGWNGGWDGSIGWLGMILMMVFWIAIVVGVVMLIVWLVRQSQGAHTAPGAGGQAPAAGETPLDILNKRYARGEIDKAEYEEKKRDLSS